MFKFKATSNLVLGLLFLLALLAFIAVENGKKDVKQDYYNEKLEAARLSQAAAGHIKQYRLQKGVFLDDVNDPNQTALIGQEYTMITTDQGNVESKLSATNPNFAAVIVQLLKEAGLEEGDPVAIAFSGSFPGMNISVMAAIETLKLQPTVITSVGASNFGANDPYFTWLDIETLLNDAGIFHYKSVAASIGGGNDIGRGLSPEGRNLIISAIERNRVELINEKHLENSIARRMEIYEQQGKKNAARAFINVGGGIASLGNTVNGQLIPSGLTERLPMSNYPLHGVIIQMGRKGIPIIHLLNIDQLAAKYGLPANPVPMPEPGEGGIFIQKKYDLVVTTIALAILVTSIIFIYLAERKRHQLGTDVVPVVPGQRKQQAEDEMIEEI
ncbi:MAG TPA: poly-gamma-glutamate system protein [Bacteroidales bacterium]|nr:poly-gamma-glutamate system protein [Bacteroidales bacterium]HPM92198.1 poly-gamma-glutamate system protein [Bacteroidales bacterium]